MGGKDLITASLRARLDTALVALERRVLSGPLPCTKLALEILREFIVGSRFRTPLDLMRAVSTVGKELMNGASHELSIGNVVRRVLFIIREEVARLVGDRQERLNDNSADREDRSRNNSLDDDGGLEATERVESQDNCRSLMGSMLNVDSCSVMSEEESEAFAKRMGGLRQAVVHSINELYEELDNLYGPICEQSSEYIHADECIFTFGYSLVVELFLKAAARKRRFFVIVAEGGPLLEGHKLAASLAKVHNIAVTLVPDSNVYPLMARVNKVVLSPHAVLADGGIIAPSGCEMVAIAAKDHSVPLVCLATTFELSPVFAHNHREVLSLLLSPSLVIDYNAAAVNANVEAIVAAYDYVPPLLIDTYITNSGTHQPSYIYRLLGEYYHPADTLEDA